jgi:predicted MPP superfamily phosphohydrolase
MASNVNNSRSKTDRAVSRRDFLRILKLAGLDLVFLTLVGGYYLKQYEPDNLEVVDIKLKLPRLPRAFSGFRLAQISDLHFGGWMNADRLDEIFSAVADLSPDVLAITGDLTYGHSRHSREEDQKRYADLVQVLSTHTKEFLTVGANGNHDYWVDSTVMKDIYQKGGVVELNNVVYSLKSGGDSLHIAGVDNVWYGDDRLDLVNGQIPNGECAILLAHEPDFADTSAKDGRFDLQLSGHSHGGQIVLPFLGPPVLPRWGKKYPSGLYRVDDMFQYTNRGVGMIPPYIRLNCRPEITLFTLETA